MNPIVRLSTGADRIGLRRFVTYASETAPVIAAFEAKGKARHRPSVAILRTYSTAGVAIVGFSGSTYR
jgi:hypothetical protein